MKRWPIAIAGACALTSSSFARADDDPKREPLPSTSTSAPVTSPSATTVTSADGNSATATPVPTASPPAAERSTITLYNSARPNKAYLYTGGLMLLGAYATTATMTAVSDNANADKNLYLPVVGPWLHLTSSAATASNSTTDTLLVAGSGVIQGVGAGLMLVSLFIPEKIPAATIQAGNTKVHVTPTSFGVGSAGLGAGGAF